MVGLERGSHGLCQLQPAASSRAAPWARALQGGLLAPEGAHKLPQADVLDVAAVASEEGRATARGEAGRGHGL